MEEYVSLLRPLSAVCVDMVDPIRRLMMRLLVLSRTGCGSLSWLKKRALIGALMGSPALP